MLETDSEICFDDVEIDFSISSTSNMIIRVEGKVVRKYKNNGICMAGIYFDDKRDMGLLEKLTPYLNIKE
jgi:hypothetical protein